MFGVCVRNTSLDIAILFFFSLKSVLLDCVFYMGHCTPHAHQARLRTLQDITGPHVGLQDCMTGWAGCLYTVSDEEDGRDDHVNDTSVSLSPESAQGPFPEVSEIFRERNRGREREREGEMERDIHCQTSMK